MRDCRQMRVCLRLPFQGSLIYVFFGTIKEVSIGPTSLMALLTLQYTVDKPPEFAIILAFLAGCVELAMGILKLGKHNHIYLTCSLMCEKKKYYSLFSSVKKVAYLIRVRCQVSIRRWVYSVQRLVNARCYRFQCIYFIHFQAICVCVWESPIRRTIHEIRWILLRQLQQSASSSSSFIWILCNW